MLYSKKGVKIAIAILTVIAVVLIGGNDLSSIYDDFEEILKGLQGTLSATPCV